MHDNGLCTNTLDLFTINISCACMYDDDQQLLIDLFYMYQPWPVASSEPERLRDSNRDGLHPFNLSECM